MGATYIYNLNFFCGFIIAFGIYYLLCRVFPVPATSEHWLEVDDDATGRNNSLVYDVEPYYDERSYDRLAEDVKMVARQARPSNERP